MRQDREGAITFIIVLSPALFFAFVNYFCSGHVIQKHREVLQLIFVRVRPIRHYSDIITSYNTGPNQSTDNTCYSIVSECRLGKWT